MSGGWTDGMEHPREALGDVLDGRADPDVTARVRAHLDTCRDCKAEWRALEGARRAAAALRVDRPVPPDLRAAILDAIDADDAGTGARPAVGASPARPRHVRSWYWWGAGVAAALVALAVYVGQPASPAIPALVAHDFAAVVAGERVTLDVESDEARTIEAFFATETSGAPVPRVRVIDLGMMGFALEGARRHSLDGRPSALYVYRGRSDERIVCQMFEGSLDRLPPTADVRENGGFRFHVYREGDVSLVFWQEGQILCVLASRMPVDDLVQLAFAKAMQPT